MDQDSSATTLVLLCCALIALLSLPGGIQPGRIKREARWPPVEPFARTMVSLMLIDAICKQAGYNGDDEDEARDVKNRDIVFLDQETRVSLLVRVDGVARNLNGKVDFAIWYEGDRHGMGTNLVAIEAKRLEDARKGIGALRIFDEP